MQKKIDFQNFRLSGALSNWANNTMTIHPIKKEWRTAIVFLAIAKLGTMAVSAYAGFSFFFALFLPVLKASYYAVIASVITLILLEFLTAVFLEKTFKFTFRQRFFTALGAFAAVLLFYSASFVSSTNGLAQRQAKAKDNTADIVKLADAKKDAINKEYAARLAEADRSIETIKSNPQGWSGGRRLYMTAEQLADIEKLTNKKDSTRAQLQTGVITINIY